MVDPFHWAVRSLESVNGSVLQRDNFVPGPHGAETVCVSVIAPLPNSPNLELWNPFRNSKAAFGNLAVLPACCWDCGSQHSPSPRCDGWEFWELSPHYLWSGRVGDKHVSFGRVEINILWMPPGERLMRDVCVSLAFAAHKFLPNVQNKRPSFACSLSLIEGAGGGVGRKEGGFPIPIPDL